MDWKTFISSMIDSLAWPITTGVAIYLLRDAVGTLLERTLRVKHRDTEIEFAEAMGAIKERAEILTPSGVNSESLRADRDRLRKVASIVPRSALLQAWNLLDREVSDLLVHLDVAPEGRSLRTRDVAEYLHNLGLSAAQVNTFLKLRRVMKSIVGPSAFELSEEQVDSYIDLSIDIVSVMQKLRSADDHQVQIG